MTRRRATADGGTVIYAYGVTRSEAPRRRSALAGVPGILPQVGVGAVMAGDLTILVSRVPASVFGAAALPAALADRQWLRERILAHEASLEALRARFPLLPCRFATIYRGLAQAGEAVAGHREALHRALDRVEDAAEWGVKLFCDGAALGRWIEATSAAVMARRAALVDASAGVGFFLKKKVGQIVDSEAQAALADCLARSRARLAASAREAAEIPVQPPAAHGRVAAMVLNAAYLVSDAKRGHFRRALAGLQKEFSAQGFEYELTGPWPAYHFVSQPAEVAARA